MYLSLENDTGLGWSTSQNHDTNSNYDFGEDALQDEFGWNEGRNFSSKDELRRAEKAWRKARKSRDAQIHFRMWILSVLERVGVCSIVGVLREGEQMNEFKKYISEGLNESAAFELVSNKTEFNLNKLVLGSNRKRDSRV